MIKSMLKKGFIWYLFEREFLFFIAGIIIGIALTFLVAQGYIPIPLQISPAVPVQ